MTSYGYRRESRFLRNIEGAVPGVVDAVLLSDGSLRVTYDDALDDYRKGVLDDVLAQLGYTPQPPNTLLLQASSKIVDHQAALQVGWSDLGGVVASPSFFSPDLSQVVGRVVGAYRADGVGAKLCICENGVPMSAELDLASTADWTPFGFDTNKPPSAGRNIYTLRGDLGAAVSAEIEYVSMSLLVRVG